VNFLRWLKEEYEALEPGQRASVRIGLGVIALILFVIVMAHSANASTLTAKDASGNSVTISDEACTINSPWFKKWRRGTMTYNGKMLDICWRLAGTTVAVIDSEGDITPIPMRFFHNAVEAKAF